MDLDDLRARWDNEAAHFDDEVDHGLTTASARRAFWSVLARLLPAPPATVADLGCGTGTISVLLAEHGYDVTGIDLSPQMIDRARKKVDTASVGVTFALGDVSAPELAPDTYDVVCARHVVWALPDPRLALERWFDLLAPGGVLVLVEGCWETGAGLPASKLLELLPSGAQHSDVLPLRDPDLWGREVSDERYVLSAYAQNSSQA